MTDALHYAGWFAIVLGFGCYWAALHRCQWCKWYARLFFLALGIACQGIGVVALIAPNTLL
jgi:hypothetical protein